MQPNPPITGTGSFTYDLDYRVTKNVERTVTAVFGNPSTRPALISPGMASVPFDPMALEVTCNQLQAAVSDEWWGVTMTLMTSISATGYDAASASHVNYNRDLYWTNGDLGMGAGDGSSAYLLSAQDVIDGHRDLLLSGEFLTLSEGYSFMNASGMSGLNWQDQYVRVLRVLVDGKDITQEAASVPMPATFALLLPGLMLIGASTRRRKAVGVAH